MIKIKINNREIETEKGKRILDVCKENDIKVPHFCYHPRLKIAGACRMCIVEVEGSKNLQASCSTLAKEGMVIWTSSKRVIEARRVILELLLANHDLNCPTCRKNLNCKLQKYSNDYMIESIRFEGEERKEEVDDSSVSIVRDQEKCILCGRCIRVCNDIQTVYALDNFKRGFDMSVGSPFGCKLAESSCVNCGQCVVNCPTGALVEKSNVAPVVELLTVNIKDPKRKHLVVQVAPSIRATLGESFGMEPGTLVTGKIVTALKRLGFDMVFDTDLAADITIVEEASEFIKRFKSKNNLPMITTCCPAWIKFGEQYFYEELDHMSTCLSPQAMMGRLVKTYYAEKIGTDPKDIIMVDIMPCTAKKFEINRPELKGDVDYVLTTVELAQLIKEFDIDFANLPDSNFDGPLGESTGAGTIFGRSGGVMEAALRTAADMLAGENLQDVDYHDVRGMETLKEANLTINKTDIKIAVVQTLGEARKLMQTIKEGKCDYHFIEIMACYGGCIGGGGQPYLAKDELLKKRAQALNTSDEKGQYTKYRKSHQNPTLKQLYEDYIGDPGGERAHELLHTYYTKRDFIG